MKNKIVATLLAFVLGGLGIHRFYLGQPKKGWLYLGFSWTPIPWLLGLIDAIGFTGMSYADFNRKYSLRHAFRKKFEDEESLHLAHFEAKREEELLRKIEALKTKEAIRQFLEDAKQKGDYLPRVAHARACAILEDRPWENWGQT